MSDARAKRLWLYLPFAAGAAILFAYWLLWRTVAGEIKVGVEDWAIDQREAGLDVAHGRVFAEGFPFFLRVHVESPSIEAPGVGAWSTDRLTLDALPYDLNRMIFSIRSDQRLRLDNGGDWTIAADDFRASIANDKARDWVFSMTIANAEALRNDAPALARAGSLIFDLSPAAEDRSTMVLSLAAADLAAGDAATPIALDGLRTVVAARQAQALSDPAVWRALGGALVVSGLEAEAGTSRLSVSGAITLDAANRPSGELKSIIAAPGPFIQSLADAGLVEPQSAERTAAALTLAAIAGGGAINAPIVLENGEARIANVAIAHLPPLH